MKQEDVAIPEPMKFSDLNLIPDVARAIDEMGFEEPTQVQAQVVPVMLGGQDVIAQARTGTGKTAAFGIPIVQAVDSDENVPQALVLTPTRELAVQVAGEIGRIAHFRPIRVVPVYGGQPISRQLRALNAGAHVIIGTPGRVLDHLRRGTLDLQHIRTLILDEADEMLDLGFLDDVEAILRQTNPQRQTALFSATMPMAILRLTDRYMRSPERIQLARPRGLTVPQTRQRYFVVPGERAKFEALCRILDLTEPRAAIIFCATKRGADHLAVDLKGRGYDAEPIHGDLNQVQRDKVMRAFREHRTELLIATDVAARGIDIEGLSHVINYDMPQDTERYVHRIGRTGRIGHAGEAITIVTPWEIAEIEEISAQTGSPIEPDVLPAVAEEVDGGEEAVEPGDLVQRRLAEILRQGQGRPYRAIIDGLVGDHDPAEIAAAALALADQIAERSGETPVLPRSAEPAREPVKAAESGAATRQRSRPNRGDSTRQASEAGDKKLPAREGRQRTPTGGRRGKTQSDVRIVSGGDDLASFSRFARGGRRRR